VTPAIVDFVGQSGIPPEVQKRLVARYGKDSPEIIESAPAEELDFIPGTTYLWAEVRWAAANESVVHLDDLLLRRVRLGLVSQHGGKHHLPRIRAIVQSELCWDDKMWENECLVYLSTWHKNYSLPDRASIPNVQEISAKA
jgi:glycerol-3-phosphate dehydrogenase